MIYLPEEINEKTEGNITTITHNNYKQLKFIDKDKKETFRELLMSLKFIILLLM